MKQKFNVFLLLATLLLVGCDNNKVEDSSSASDSGSSTQSSPSEGSSETSNNGSTSESNNNSGSSSEELPPIDDPDISGLVRSEEWPSGALYEYLSYTKMFVMPDLISETSFHHGLYNDELFYRVLTRVRTQGELNTYKKILEDENDFIFELDEYNTLRGETYHGEVQMLLTIEPFGKFYNIAFDFFDGDEYVHKGLEAVDNVAFFNFRNREAVVERSSNRVKWEVKPVSFTVSKGSAGYPVGNTNNEHISNPLRIYAGNILKISLDNPAFYITEIKILASSGYALRFTEQGDFDTTSLDVDVSGDWITIVPGGHLTDLTYTRQNVTNVGQTRILNLTVKIARK